MPNDSSINHNKTCTCNLLQALTDLNGGKVSLEPDDLPDQLVVADPDELVHGGAGHLDGRDDGAGHGVDVAEHALLFLVGDLGQLLIHGARHPVGVCDASGVSLNLQLCIVRTCNLGTWGLGWHQQISECPTHQFTFPSMSLANFIM